MALSREYVLLTIVILAMVGFTAAYVSRSTNRDVAKADTVAADIKGKEWELVRPIDMSIILAPGSGNTVDIPFKILGQLDNSEMIIQLKDDRGVFQLAGVDVDSNHTEMDFNADSGGQQVLVDDMPTLNGAGDNYTYEGYIVLQQNGDWTVDGTIMLTFVIDGYSETREIKVRA